jgi:putative NADH-flavin reductase
LELFLRDTKLKQKMRMFILGASGGIGTHLLKIAIEKGHDVTAYVRSPQKIEGHRERLTVVPGDVFDVPEMSRAMAGHEIVLSAFGPASLRASKLRRQFGRTVAAAMRDSGVSRLQLVSAAFLFEKLGLFARILKTILFRRMAPDMAGMEAEVAHPEFGWTIVRPPRLTNGPARHAYRVANGSLPAGGFLISRADVAHFMIGEAEVPKHRQQIVGIAN